MMMCGYVLHLFIYCGLLRFEEVELQLLGMLRVVSGRIYFGLYMVKLVGGNSLFLAYLIETNKNSGKNKNIN